MSGKKTVPRLKKPAQPCPSKMSRQEDSGVYQVTVVNELNGGKAHRREQPLYRLRYRGSRRENPA